MTYARQDMSCPHDFAVLERIDGACASRDRRKILAAVGEDGTLHAVAYLVWDEQAAYYLAGGGDPEKRTSGAASLLMWEAIKFASTVSRTFDFEGSMLEPVDRFFRGFGAEPTPYSCIQKQSQVVSLMRQSKDGLTRLKERIAGR